MRQTGLKRHHRRSGTEVSQALHLLALDFLMFSPSSLFLDPLVRLAHIAVMIADVAMKNILLVVETALRTWPKYRNPTRIDDLLVLHFLYAQL
jgi:hypothetical protein